VGASVNKRAIAPMYGSKVSQSRGPIKRFQLRRIARYATLWGNRTGDVLKRFIYNPYRQAYPEWDERIRAPFGEHDIAAVHRSLPEYRPTPLTSLPSLAGQLGGGAVPVKDESHRFGLKAFKALGSTYALYRLVRRHLEAAGRPCPPAESFFSEVKLPEDSFTFCTATDGNHGRGVAWAARKLRQRAVIYMPGFSVEARIENIRKEGAEVIVIDGGYDEAVRRCARDAENHGWQIISDTSWPGYEEIPRWIQAGYMTMFNEIHSDPPVEVDLVIVPAGVGALAATVSWYYNRVYPEPRPKLVSVEPIGSDCMLQSIASPNGEPLAMAEVRPSIMVGLTAGTPSQTAWPLVKQGYDLFMTVTDDSAREAMRLYYRPLTGDPQIISGESGAAGMAALLTLCRDPAFTEARRSLDLSAKTRVLLLNTEGDTDPEGFKKIIGWFRRG